MSGLMIMGMCVGALAGKLHARQEYFDCEDCKLRCIRLIDDKGNVVLEGRGRGLEGAGPALIKAAGRAGIQKPWAPDHVPAPDLDMLSSRLTPRAEVRLTRCEKCGAVLLDLGCVDDGKPLLGRGDIVEAAYQDLMAQLNKPEYYRGRKGRPCMSTYIFTSESVTEGHPDKVADLIADSILDAHLEQDPNSRVACEVLVKEGHVVIAGEITSNATVDVEQIARDAILSVGYADPDESFHAEGVDVQTLLTRQVSEIAAGVDRATDDPNDQGAGDQGIMFGYATDERLEVTPQSIHQAHLMPLPIHLAHRLSRQMAEDRRSGRVPWLRPDGKAQVSVEYEWGRVNRVTDVVVSAHHSPSVRVEEVRAYIRDDLVPRVLDFWMDDKVRILANPAGSFTLGGPSADCGVTGRKIIVDSYGGAARHGGGAFSGKDPSKVDRSGAYFCRWAARQIVVKGLARRAELQVAYAIGTAQPVSVFVETFGSGDHDAAEQFVRSLDFRPRAIIQKLGLLRPIYRGTTNYGHFGREGLPWES